MTKHGPDGIGEIMGDVSEVGVRFLRTLHKGYCSDVSDLSLYICHPVDESIFSSVRMGVS